VRRRRGVEGALDDEDAMGAFARFVGVWGIGHAEMMVREGLHRRPRAALTGLQAASGSMTESGTHQRIGANPLQPRDIREVIAYCGRPPRQGAGTCR
jgi:hypothetical protein